MSADKTIYLRGEDRQCSFVGTDVAGMQIKGQTEIQMEISPNPKTTYSRWARAIAHPISKLDDFRKHIFREHYQEADHWANRCAERRRIIIVDKGNNTERWTERLRRWKLQDQRKKRVVVKEVDKNKWTTIIKIEVFLWFCSLSQGKTRRRIQTKCALVDMRIRGGSNEFAVVVVVLLDWHQEEDPW